MNQEKSNSSVRSDTWTKERIIKAIKLYTKTVEPLEKDVVGRELEERRILAAFMRPEISNVILLGEPGSGKTTLVRGVAGKDKGRLYREVEMDRLIKDASNPNVLAGRLKELFRAVSEYKKMTGKEVVLFIDEFHSIINYSSVATEALKPMLAESGRTGIRFIAATTFVEFRQSISPNQALVERLQRISLDETDKETTLQILRNFLDKENLRYECPDHVLEKLYDATEKNVPANVQPRKSIVILNAMIGWYRSERRQMDMKLLNECFIAEHGINLFYSVDGNKIKETLDAHVFDQGDATRAIEEHLQTCVAGLNDPTRPMCSFLFCGSTGVGKTEMAKQLSKILFNRQRLIRFDMTEYSSPDSATHFRKELTNAVWTQPNSVIMIDEVEKSHRAVTQLLMQVLDDARLIDENGRPVSFTNSYIILTTNAGSEIFQELSRGNLLQKEEEKRAKGMYGDVDHWQRAEITDDEKELLGQVSGISSYIEVIKKSLLDKDVFPAELLGRIDAIVPFKPLSLDTKEKIVRYKLDKLFREIKSKHDVCVITDEKENGGVMEFLLQDKLDNTANDGGARQIANVIHGEVTSRIARYINTHPDCKNLCLYVKGITRHGNAFSKDSYAHIEIREFNPERLKSWKSRSRTFEKK